MYNGTLVNRLRTLNNEVEGTEMQLCLVAYAFVLTMIWQKQVEGTHFFWRTSVPNVLNPNSLNGKMNT